MVVILTPTVFHGGWNPRVFVPKKKKRTAGETVKREFLVREFPRLRSQQARHTNNAPTSESRQAKKEKASNSDRSPRTPRRQVMKSPRGRSTSASSEVWGGRCKGGRFWGVLVVGGGVGELLG